MMKAKLILLAALLVCSAMPLAAQNEKNIVKSKSNITNNRASIEKALMEKERMAWKNLVDKKYEDFGKNLADDYQSVYGTSRNTKASELAGVKQSTFKSAIVTDLQAQMVSADVWIVTAMVKAEILDADGKAQANNFRTTSVYAKREEVWLLVFHTDEPIEPTK